MSETSDQSSAGAPAEGQSPAKEPGSKSSPHANKVFVGGLSWETHGDRLRSYFENFGAVREAFVSYNRTNGRPRGFGFVVFESSDVVDKVVAAKHMIDRREVEAKRAVPKEETAQEKPAAPSSPSKTRKVFVGGLAPSVDEAQLREHFSQFGEVEDAVVMYDHENKRPRGFGFVSFVGDDAVDKVFARGAVQTLAEKPIEIKSAVPRDQMPPPPRAGGMHPGSSYYPPQRGGPHGGHYGGPGGHRGGGGYYGPPPSYGPPPYHHHHPGYGPRGPYGGRGGGGYGPPPPHSMHHHHHHPGYGPPPRGPPRGGAPPMPGPYPGPGAYGPPPQPHMPAPQGAMPRGYPQQAPPPQPPQSAPQASPPKGVPQVQQAVPGPYDMSYAALQNGVNNAMLSSAIYNLAGQLGIPNGLPNPAAVKQAAQTTAGLNALNNQLKALNLTGAGLAAATAAGFSFPSQGDQVQGYQDDGTYANQEDYSAAEAVQGLNNLAGVNPADYTNAAFHEAGGFTTAPAPGWSS